MIVSAAVFFVPLTEAEIVTVALGAVGKVDTVNVAVCCPAGTVTLTGTEAFAGCELASFTTSPPLGAGADRLTVPVEALPRITLDGFRPSEAMVAAGGGGGGGGGVMVSALVFVVPPIEAVTPTTAVVVTAEVVTVKDADEAPAATSTLAGTPTVVGLALDTPTTVPPDGAAPLSVTVPVDGLPPTTLGGVTPSDASDTALAGPGVQPS